MAIAIARLGPDKAIEAVRRLDRPHRGGRAAVRQAGAAAGHRAQRRHHDVGLGHAKASTSTTRSRATSATRRSTPTARSTDRRRRAPTWCRCSIRSHNEASPHQASLSRPADAARPDQPRGPLGLLGRRADLGRPHQHPQPDDRRERPRVVHGAHPAGRTIRHICKEGSDHPSAKVVPLKESGAPALGSTIRRRRSGR